MYASDTSQTIFNLLYREGVQQVTLRADLRPLMDNIRDTAEYPATFSFIDRYGKLRELRTEVSLRGRFRRMNCDFPPFKLDFDKDSLRKMGLLDFDDFKLVTHCTDSIANDENVLREYVAYKLYRNLTGYSLRAQLVEITYINDQTGQSSTRMGIILEDEDELAHRLQGQLCEDCYGLNKDDFNEREMIIQDLFQYLIGNTDWSVASQKNLKLVRLDKGNKFIAVPYDFDFCGMVNAPYAVPNPDIGQANVRERHFLGFEYSKGELAQARDFFLAKRPDLEACIEACPVINNSCKRDMMRYLKQFYRKIRNLSEFP